MMVWFRPSTMVRAAIGSCTPISRWNPLAPSDSEASTLAWGTERMPCAV